MAEPTVVDISHTLGRAEAKRRLAARIGDVPSMIPGGMAEVKASWPSEYRMALEISAMAQRIAATIDIEDTRLRVTLELPAMLGFFAGAITSAVREHGTKLLLPAP
jgi:hypothetical protein